MRMCLLYIQHMYDVFFFEEEEEEEEEKRERETRRSSLPSTVSPIDSTSVALRNDTTMYASCSSVAARLTVHTFVGEPGSGGAAISVTARPGERQGKR